MAVIDGAIEALRSAGTAGLVGVGDPAPSFTLPSARGDVISLGDLLGRRAVVLSFYRGGW
jgi:peroxiredoxin